MNRSCNSSLVRTKWFWILSLLLVLATATLYVPVDHHPFTNYDDDQFVTSNPHTQSGLDWTTVQWAFSTYEFASWHPLTWMSHALDCQLFGLDPAGHHDTNLLLHLVNVLLLFWVLAQATGSLGRSAMVAALFALHPMNVESVAWISERKNLLSMVFFLLALAAYGWYAASPKLGRYLTVAGLFALGLMAKPQIITLPCVLLLWDYWPLQRMFTGDAKAPNAPGAPPLPGRSFSSLVWEKVPLLLLAAGGALITERAQQASGLIAVKWRLSVRLGNAIVSYARYIGKAFWPSRLSLFYPHPGSSLSVWQVSGAFLVLLAITAAVLASFRQRRYLLVGWLWFLGTLVPMSGIAPSLGEHAIADRYAYLSFVGLFIMICWSVAEWAGRRNIPVRLLCGVSVAILLALALVARIQLNYWRDNVTLWTHALQVTPDNSIAETSLGSALMDDKRFDEALVHYRAALAISPLDPVANLDVGFLEQKQGDFHGAIERYQRVIETTQKRELKMKALVNLGYVYRDMGDTEKARESFAEAKAMQR
jgi:protein O-mannosyl-transferase